MEIFDPQRLYTPTEIADRFGKKYMTVWGWIKSGRLQAMQIEGGGLLIRGSDANNLVKPVRPSNEEKSPVTV